MKAKDYMIKLAALNYIDFVNRKAECLIVNSRSLTPGLKRSLMLYAKCRGIVGHDRILNER